jgi:hypothetical protein
MRVLIACGYGISAGFQTSFPVSPQLADCHKMSKLPQVRQHHYRTGGLSGKILLISWFDL